MGETTERRPNVDTKQCKADRTDALDVLPKSWKNAEMHSGSDFWSKEVENEETFQDLLDNTFSQHEYTQPTAGDTPARLLIVSVHRLEHPKFWKVYQQSVSKMMAKRRAKPTALMNLKGGPPKTVNHCGTLHGLDEAHVKGINEVFLWFGCSTETGAKIVETGFEEELANSTQRGFEYGKGIHLAENSSRADELAGKTEDGNSGTHCLLLCRVALGEVLTISGGGKKNAPLIKTAMESGAYDAVVGECPTAAGHGHIVRDFMLEDPTRLYVEYLVMYQREAKTKEVV